MQMVAVLQHLKQETAKWNIHVPTDYKSGSLNFVKPYGLSRDAQGWLYLM
jgi:hypothetical protein